MKVAPTIPEDAAAMARAGIPFETVPSNKPIVISLGNSGAGAMLSGITVELSEKLWLTEDRKHVVPDGSRKAAFLLGVSGDRISIEQARELGLSVDDEDENDTPKTKQGQAPAKDKNGSPPAENK